MYPALLYGLTDRIAGAIANFEADSITQGVGDALANRLGESERVEAELAALGERVHRVERAELPELAELVLVERVLREWVLTELVLRERVLAN